MQTLFFPFGAGLHQETDDRLQDPGTPREIRNLVAAKKGRLETRKDYDALPMDNDQGTTMTLFDVHDFKGRLVAFADIEAVVTPASPTDVVEYVGQPTGAWRGTSSQRSGSILSDPGPRLGLVTGVRDIVTPAFERDTSYQFDVAAGGGRVCIAWMNDPANGITCVQVVDAQTRASLLVETFTLNADTIRVVCVGSVFFLANVTSVESVSLYRFNPASDDHFVLLDAVAAPVGTNVLAMDLALSNEGTTFWMVVARAAGFRVYGYNSSGVETHDFPGAAVSASAVTVLTESSTASTLRVHVACSITGTTVVDLYTYLTNGALETGTANILADTSSRQVGLVLKDSSAGLLMLFNQDGDDVDFTHVQNNTHVVGVARTWFNAFLSTKATVVRGRMFVGMALDSGDDQFSNLMACPDLDDAVSARVSSSPGALVDSDTAHDTDSPFSLPTLATDSSTGKSYWGKLRRNAIGNVNLSLTELEFCGTDRRQMVTLGDAAYIAGGLPQAYDGQQLAETCFLHRPRIVSSSQDTGGSKTQLGTYQTLYVYECSDANRNRIQGPPSAILETTFTGTNDRIFAVVSAAVSLHNRHSSSVPKGASAIVGYSTLDTNGGDLTFQRDSVQQVAYGDDIGESLTVAHSQSDADLSDEEILYTQAARGALSGPLAFEAMQPCTSLDASADRVLSCGLPNREALQESRPLLVGEQVYWSNSIAFQRAASGEILAVARLDERRIAWTDSKVYELDGPGVDDNGNGDIGAARELPSDVGLYGGALGWRSIVKWSGGLMFQGLANMIYILPRGSVTPVPAGEAVEDTLEAYPVITSATYIPESQEVRFTCNNSDDDDGIVLVYAVRFKEWFVEGPFGAAITAGTRYQGRFVMLRENVVYQQRATHPPATFIEPVFRSGVIHPFKPGNQGRVYGVHFIGGFRGNCRVKCIVRFNEGVDDPAEELETVDVFDLEPGQPFSYRWEAEQLKCECVEVDFEVTDLNGEATQGLDWNYWALEVDASGTAALRAPLQMS